MPAISRRYCALPSTRSAGIAPAFRIRLLVIDVGEEKVERAHALLQTALEHRPFVRRNDARHDVERDQSLGAAVVAVHRERDADAVECALGLVALLRDAGDVRALEPVGERPVMGPHPGVRGGHFVVRVGRTCGRESGRRDGSKRCASLRNPLSPSGLTRPYFGCGFDASPIRVTAARSGCILVLDKVGHRPKVGLTLLPPLWLNRGSCLGSRGV